MMSVLPIIKIGHPTLRKVAKSVDSFDIKLQKFVGDMIETMKVNEGIGLAAPQVNVLERIFVIDKKLIKEEWEAEAYINPELLAVEGAELLEEGCLSIPDIREEVERALKIQVKYQNLEGKEIFEELEGLHARVFLHELDHLEGILFIDRISNIKRKLIEPQIKEIKEANLNY
jgi:peptide deformylase